MKDRVKIDFVITWVDGNDPKWQQEFAKYSGQDVTSSDKRECRYRDWDLLRYWFRGVEKYAPWVNKVHFITCGQVPEWLNLEHPKLHYVNHCDYIPAEYLPTFNANPIELNLHRIDGLQEHFVYFNDDFFLIDDVRPENFFNNGLPCDIAGLALLAANGIAHIDLNNVQLINTHFDKREVMRSHFAQWFNLKYGKSLIGTLLTSPFPYFEAFKSPHLPYALLKSTFDEVWNKCHKELKYTSETKFRKTTDVSIWLMRYWQLVTGRFYPRNTTKDGSYYEINDRTIGEIERAIVSHVKPIIVLNDSDSISSFEEHKRRLQTAFDQILPNQSSFEKVFV